MQIFWWYQQGVFNSKNCCSKKKMCTKASKRLTLGLTINFRAHWDSINVQKKMRYTIHITHPSVISLELNISHVPIGVIERITSHLKNI